MATISRRAILGGITGLAAGAVAPHIQAQRAKKRNVLFIATDDMNNSLGCYGHPLAKTPHLDGLAARGVRFDRACCQYPLCSPSRTSIMTGLSPDATRVYDLKLRFRETVPRVTTLPQHFQQNGYYAARVGKIYHYGVPSEIGTDGLDDKASWNHVVNPKGVDKIEEPKITNYTPQRGLGSSASYYVSPAPDEQHTDGITVDATLDLMAKHRNDPFFLAAGFYRPHVPLIAPSKYFDKVPLSSVDAVPFSPSEMEIAPKWAYFTNPPNWNMTEQQVREIRRAYFASIMFVDSNVGKLLAGLKKLGLDGNTTIVFWSDHGYALGEHGQWMKQALWETVARVPFIMAGAGVEGRGRPCGRTVELLGLYPTLSEICGLANRPAHLQGTSFLPLLRNPNAAWDHPAITQVRRRAEDPLMGYSIRNERYRYSMWDDAREGEEFYDYRNDPREMKNLAGIEGAHTAIQHELAARLRKTIAARRVATGLG
ncbi:MAG: sulfatase [Bryobacterales bacterium]|nr:sulfatase [Bryobacterales bacterium]